MTADQMIPKGVWPVMITPFHTDRTIDWRGLDQLIDWYLEAGIAGLFAVCLSSEIFELDEGERIALAEHVVRRVDGTVPVVASGTFGNSLEEKADSIRKTAGAGVAAVVCLVSSLLAEGEAELEWCRQTEKLLAQTGDIPLGLYECPLPYHRILKADSLAWAASTGRFLFLKETSGRSPLFKAKLSATRGTKIRLFNADAASLLDSLHFGADGFCGVSANFVPELWAWLCRHFESEPEAARRLHGFLGAAERTIVRNYPASAKRFLSMRGLRIEPVCRTAHLELTEQDERELMTLKTRADEWRVELGIA